MFELVYFLCTHATAQGVDCEDGNYQYGNYQPIYNGAVTYFNFFHGYIISKFFSICFAAL